MLGKSTTTLLSTDDNGVADSSAVLVCVASTIELLSVGSTAKSDVLGCGVLTGRLVKTASADELVVGEDEMAMLLIVTLGSMAMLVEARSKLLEEDRDTCIGMEIVGDSEAKLAMLLERVNSSLVSVVTEAAAIEVVANGNSTALDVLCTGDIRRLVKGAENVVAVGSVVVTVVPSCVEVVTPIGVLNCSFTSCVVLTGAATLVVGTIPATELSCTAGVVETGSCSD